MTSPSSPSRAHYGRRPGRPGVTEPDVERVADQLLREGKKRPTVASIRAELGGSASTVAPLLDSWWQRLSQKLIAGPAAFERIPTPLAHIAEALWLQTLSEARVRAQSDVRSAVQESSRDKMDYEVRSHVLSLREGELEQRLRDRERVTGELESRVRVLTVLLQKEQASHAAQGRRVAALEADLLALQQSRAAVRKPKAVLRRRPKRVAPPTRESVPAKKPAVKRKQAMKKPSRPPSRSRSRR